MKPYFNQWRSTFPELAVSVEDNVINEKGQEVEIEKEFYAEVDLDEIAKLATEVEDQEQWSVKNNKAQIRVRKTTEETTNGPKFSYELTLKGPKVDNTNTENNVDIDKQFFFDFKDHFADKGMVKTRYTIPDANSKLVFEVDVYEGTNWVKIDVEVPSEDTPIPKFPFETKQVIPGGRNDKRTAEQQATLDKLYDTFFLVTPADVSMESKK